MNWDELSDAAPSWRPAGWRLWAIWPSPVDHDLCMAEAGFDDFGDSDDDWVTDFALLVQDLLRALGRRGNARLERGEFGPKKGDLGDALVTAAWDDNAASCAVTFGEPAQALLGASNGHPILWMALADGDATDVREALGARHELRERELLWEKLL